MLEMRRLSCLIFFTGIIVISTLCELGQCSNVDFQCVVSPPVRNTYSQKPVILRAFVDGSFRSELGYSITFASRDDPAVVTNGKIANFGKIGTSKGEKGDKGDLGLMSVPKGCVGAPGLIGDAGVDGSVMGQGLNGAKGDTGSNGDQGPVGPSGAPGTPGVSETYCTGEIPMCRSMLHGYQCIQGPKGVKGPKGASCLPGLQGEKGDPSDPYYLGPKGLKGSAGTPSIEPGFVGQDNSGEKGEPGINAPQLSSCTLSDVIGMPGIMLDVGGPGEAGDPGTPGQGPKGAKGVKGIKGAPGLSKGPQGDKGATGLPGITGPTGDPGLIPKGDNGLFIRPLFQTEEAPRCVSNVQVAVETLTLYEPEDSHYKDARFGVFYCNFFARDADEFQVPALLYNQDELIPANAKRTFIVAVGESLDLCIDQRFPKKHVSQLVWTLNGNRTERLNRWSGSSCIHIKNVWPSDAGIYEVFKRSIGRNAKQHAYFIVIVKACPRDRYNPPACDMDCPSCQNGGYCDDDGDGTCVCLNGFHGDDCEIPNGEGLLGSNDGNVPCLDLGNGRDCKGALVCSQGAGCMCAQGWKGIHCDEPCEDGTYGPDCCLECVGPTCNRFTGDPCR